MRKLLFLTLVLLLALASAASAAIGPQVMVIEDFESYVDGDALRSEWPDYSGDPDTDLATVAHNGSQALELIYDLDDAAGTEAWVSHNLPPAADWTGMTKFTIWYQGIEGNSPDHISLLVLDEINTKLISTRIEGATAHTGWNRWDVSLEALTPEELQSVDGIVIGAELRLGVDPDVENTAGTLYFDDISVTNGVETVWIGTSDEWADSSNWTSGLPDGASDARVPAVPSGPNMPVIKAAGAAAHDLAIEQGATVNLNSFDLTITGSLDNAGGLIDSKNIGENGEESFLAAGGHPGLMITTGTGGDPAVARADEGLGDTTVTIKAGNSCASGSSTVQRCYNIVPNNPAESTITFYFDAGDLDGLSCQSLTLYNYHNDVWTRVAGPEDENAVYQCDTANFSVTVSGITDYSPFVLSEGEPVAITLQSFNVSGPLPTTLFAAAAGLLALLAISALILLRRS